MVNGEIVSREAQGVRKRVFLPFTIHNSPLTPHDSRLTIPYLCFMSSSIADIRRDYRMHMLSETEAAANPFEQFTRWWNEALRSEIDEVNAMTLATVAADGMPSARIVLLKGYDKNGFVFFTNYNSDKAREIEQHPKVALLFFWKELERQVRIEGTIKKLSETESDIYFKSRPLGSRIGAWASPQSEPISNREELESAYQKFETKFASGEVPRPPHWGGYTVKPVLFEFWQGRSSRLHDRLRYEPSEENWRIRRLAP
jgi:pyridoxamine 5'-phosphate oxidase